MLVVVRPARVVQDIRRHGPRWRGWRRDRHARLPYGSHDFDEPLALVRTREEGFQVHSDQEGIGPTTPNRGGERASARPTEREVTTHAGTPDREPEPSIAPR